ncbi:MAG: hypothetical protein WCI89_00160 [bacterium]
MKKYMTGVLSVLLATALFTAPATAFARCGAQGYTVGYVNGVLTSRPEAEADKKALVEAYTARVEPNQQNPVTFINIYNPTHLAGVGDLAESVSQMFGAPISDFDFTVMLQDLYRELTTRRVLMLGHSQGAFYANSLYTYLLAHGEPKEAVGVYAVATPASVVAGGGFYLNSQSDVALILITAAAKKAGMQAPLPPNIDIAPTSAKDIASTFPGHSFADAYVAGASDKVISDVQKSITALQPTFASETDDCFDAPPGTVAERVEAALFWVVDPVASVVATVSATVGVGAANVCL